MRLVSEIADTPQAALQRGLEIAARIVAAPAQSIRAVLASARQALEDDDNKLFAALIPTFIQLMKSEDFQARVRAPQDHSRLNSAKR